MMLAFKKIHIMLRCVYCNSIYVMKRCCTSQYLSNILRKCKYKGVPLPLSTIMLRTRSQQLENSLAVEWNFIIVSSVQLMLSASLLLTADLLAPCSSVYILTSPGLLHSQINMIFMLLSMIISVQKLWKDYTFTLDLYISDFGGKINSFLTWTNLSICTLVRPPQSQTKPCPPPHPTVQFCWAASCARQKNRVTSKNPKI